MASYALDDFSYTATDNTTGTVWNTWATSSTTITVNLVWDAWTTDGGTVSAVASGNGYNPPPLTEEQKAERAQRKAVEEEQARERKERMRLKRENARRLLIEALNELQQGELERTGYFHVETRDGTRRYRLTPNGAPWRVRGEDGRQWAYCIHPEFGYPPEDVVLAQKLLLESDEEAFLRIANASALRVPVPA